MCRGLHKFFKSVVNELNNSFPTFKKSGLEVSYFILEPINFAEVAILPADIKMVWLKTTLKYIKNVINNQTFLMDDPEK